jgi:hypothetical protein
MPRVVPPSSPAGMGPHRYSRLHWNLRIPPRATGGNQRGSFRRSACGSAFLTNEDAKRGELWGYVKENMIRTLERPRGFILHVRGFDSKPFDFGARSLRISGEGRRCAGDRTAVPRITSLSLNFTEESVMPLIRFLETRHSSPSVKTLRSLSLRTEGTNGPVPRAKSHALSNGCWCLL